MVAVVGNCIRNDFLSNRGMGGTCFRRAKQADNGNTDRVGLGTNDLFATRAGRDPTADRTADGQLPARVLEIIVTNRARRVCDR